MVGWNGVNGSVQALAVSNSGSTVYVGGAFNKANWTNRSNLAAFDAESGALRDWSPTVSVPVSGEGLRIAALAVASNDSQVFIAGPFRAMNGATVQGFASTNAVTGSNMPNFAGSYLYAPYSWGTSLAVAGDTVYLGSRDDKTTTKDRMEGVMAINTATGARRWYANCYGDTFAVLPVGNDVYVGSHSHDCYANGGVPETTPRTYLAIHALNKDTGVDRPYFVQSPGNAQQPDTLLLSRALASDGNQLVMGGGYLQVNNTPQANIARFMTGSSAPDRAAWPSGSSCGGCAYTNLTVLKGADRDDIKLTYEIYRDWSTTNPIKTVTSDSFPYLTSTFTFRDTGVVIGQQVYYRVLAKDPAGNAVWSVRTPTMTVGSTATADAAPTAKMSADSATTAKAAPTTVATTTAQRAAEAAAKQFGLQPNGKRTKAKAPKQTPAPRMDSPNLPVATAYSTLRSIDSSWLPLKGSQELSCSRIRTRISDRRFLEPARDHLQRVQISESSPSRIRGECSTLSRHGVRHRPSSNRRIHSERPVECINPKWALAVRELPVPHSHLSRPHPDGLRSSTTSLRGPCHGQVRPPRGDLVLRGVLPQSRVRSPAPGRQLVLSTRRSRVTLRPRQKQRLWRSKEPRARTLLDPGRVLPCARPGKAAALWRGRVGPPMTSGTRAKACAPQAPEHWTVE